MHLNWKVIFNILSILVLFNGLFMLLGLPIAFLHHTEGGGMHGMGGFWELFIPGALSTVLGILVWRSTKENNRRLGKRDGYLIVSLGWVLMSLTGALPYWLLGGQFEDMSCAIFEAVSGYTTTGASILTDIEAQPKAILFWRSMTHWIGGMGIIVLAIAILPLLGIGGMQLFVAEAPGPTADKLHPRITETAKRLWLIYVSITFVEMIILMFCGLGWFDAITHSFSTVSTGGFSTQNASLAAYGPLVHYVVTLFMFICGANFALIYFGIKGNLKKVWQNEEFRAYLGLVLGVTIIATLVVFWNDPQRVNVGAEEAFRDSLFQVVAVVTTTGFVTENFAAWGPFLKVIFFLLMFVGASAGSTAGGVKIVRHLIIFKSGILEFKRQLHPSAIVPVRLNKRAVKSNITLNVLAFFLIYMIIFCFGCLVLGATGLYDFETILGAVATSLGNVGPGLGAVDPVSNFAHFPWFLKLFLSFLMLLGRLELFTILILFTPYFWRKS
ncbi:MAG: TrkH family potassium uptake protein [Aureispira sp.]|nr:TrkH family potassium uptake protein [Aureispira sp.]